MALTASFSGTKSTLAYLSATETEEYWGGSSRRTLTLICDPAAMSVDALNTLASDEAKTAKITLTDSETGATSVFDDYVLKLKIGVERTLVSAETAEAAAVYADRLVLKLGRRTYIEAQLKRLGL